MEDNKKNEKTPSDITNGVKIDLVNHYRRFIIDDVEIKKKFESLFEKEIITHDEFIFAITTLKQCWDNWNSK